MAISESLTQRYTRKSWRLLGQEQQPGSSPARVVRSVAIPPTLPSGGLFSNDRGATEWKVEVLTKDELVDALPDEEMRLYTYVSIRTNPRDICETFEDS